MQRIAHASCSIDAHSRNDLIINFFACPPILLLSIDRSEHNIALLEKLRPFLVVLPLLRCIDRCINIVAKLF